MKRELPVWLGLAASVSFAQTMRDAVTIDIETDRAAQWRLDVTDPSRVAASSEPVPPAAMLNFFRSFSIQDVRIVNGVPTKGVVLFRTDRINFSPTPVPGGAIADVVRGTAAEISIEILHEGGTPVGTLVGSGLAGGTAPPGALVACGPSADPAECLQPVSNIAITGGTGAFLGARGQLVFLPPQFQTLPTGDLPTWSVATSPSRRRELAAGAAVFRICLLPPERPAIVEVLHSNGTAVTSGTPARRGETIINRASGLGPVDQALAPGRPFPAQPLAQVTSPVWAVIGGRRVDAAVKIGWPGETNLYRVDIVIPGEAPVGEQTLQIFAAWIPSAGVPIVVQ